MNFKSPNFHFANMELDWFSSDTLEKYKMNFLKKYDLLEKNEWIDYNKFTYKFNSQGFRCEEFAINPNIMFLGCSNTFGEGLPLENSWTYIVAKELNLEPINLSISGGSPDSSFRICYGYIEKIKPKILIYLEPPPGRFEVLLKNDVDLQFFPSKKDHSDDNSKFYLQWISEETNIFLDYKKNLFGIKHLCDLNDTKFLYFTFEEFVKKSQKLDLARDLHHLGKKSNYNFSRYILEKL
jgi:hypothetical protein